MAGSVVPIAPYNHYITVKTGVGRSMIPFNWGTKNRVGLFHCGREIFINSRRLHSAPFFCVMFSN